MAKRPKKSALSQQKQRDPIPGSRVPSLLGRETEIALIDQLLDRIDQGGTTLFISGAAGIGKSALLDEAKNRARERGIVVLGMTGVLAEAHLAFAGLQQALRPLMKQAKSLPAHQRSALLNAFGMGGATTEAPDIWLVALATLTLLTEGASHQPILLVVDDAQWLDDTTRQVLSFVSRRLSSDPIVLLLALREGFELPFGAAVTLRHVVPALGEADATRLLETQAPGLPKNLRSRFLREAAGNPLALVELPRSLRSEDDREAAWLPLTERLEHTFSSRLSDLPEVTRMLLYIAAENDGSSLYEIMRAGEVLLAQNLDVAALEPAVSAKLIDLDAAEARFRHPLMRSAIHQAVDLAVRQKVHAALAEVIEDQDRKLWHRAAAAMGPDDELAAELDLMARRAQRRGAVTVVTEVLQIAAKLSRTVKARRERFLQAAEIVTDLGRPALLEHLLREAAVDPSDELGTARVGWCREMSQPLMVNDLGKISALVKFADQAHASGAKDLASNLLWRAAQRCWWSNASSGTCSNVLSAARRLKFIARLLDGEQMAGLCREFGISRKTGYKILTRYNKVGLEGLTDRSRRPYRHANQLPTQIETLIVRCKQDKPSWGAPKIRERLARLYPDVHTPAISTVHAVLDRHGLVKRRTRRRNRAEGTALSRPAQPNELWCADYKGEFMLADRRYCYPLTITDFASRYLIACEALHTTKEAYAFSVFESVFKEFGLPRAIRTDNGVPFASPNALFGLSRLSVWWLRLGIEIERIKPGNPQQNGRHERMHLTLKLEATKPAAKNFLQQQAKFDDFVGCYNNERPHQALNMQCPADLYLPSLRPYRGLPDLSYPLHDKAVTVTTCGRICFNRQKINLSQVFAGQTVGIKQTDDRIWLVSFMDYDLGYFDDETCRLEPLANPFGPKVLPMSPE